MTWRKASSASQRALPVALKISPKLPEKYDFQNSNFQAPAIHVQYRYTTIKMLDLSISVTCTEFGGENLELNAGISGRHQESRRQRSIPIAFHLAVIRAFVAAAAAAAQTAAVHPDAVRTTAAPVARKTTATVLTYPFQFEHLEKNMGGNFRRPFTSTHEPCFLKFPCLACSHHCISSIGYRRFGK